MSRALTEAEFAHKVDYEGGILDALLYYGLKSEDLLDKEGPLYQLVLEFEEFFAGGLTFWLSRINPCLDEAIDEYRE